MNAVIRGEKKALSGERKEGRWGNLPSDAPQQLRLCVFAVYD